MMCLIITIFLSVSVIGKETISLNDDTYFKELKVNDERETESVFTLETGTQLTKDSLGFRFNEVCGEVINYEVLVKDICEIEERTPVHDIQEVCEYNNISMKDECAMKEVITTYNISYYYDICYKAFDTIPSYAKDYKIKAMILDEPCYDGTYGHKIDWIPSITISDTTYEKDAWEWWNESVSVNIEKILAHYDFEGDLVDEKSGYDGTDEGIDDISSNASCKDGSCLLFDGGSGYMGLNATNTPISNYSSGAISMWVKRNNNNAAMGVIYISSTTSQNFVNRFSYDDANELSTNGKKNSAWKWQIEGNTIDLNVWYHVVLNQQGNNVTLFINNVEIFEDSDTDSWWYDDLGAAFSHKIGSYSAGGTSYGFKGYVDEVTIWNESLNSSEISSLYQNGTGINLTYLIDIAYETTGTQYMAVDLNNPPDEYYTNDATPIFNFTARTWNASTFNCTFYHDDISYYHNTTVANNTLHNVLVNASLVEGAKDWFVNCTDGTNHTKSITRRLNLITTPPQIAYFNLEGTLFYANTSMNANISSTTNLGSLISDIDCFINETSNILSQDNISLINNTNHDFSTIGSGNYSRNDNISCNVTVRDNATNTATAMDYVVISDSAPTVPTDILFGTSVFFYDVNTTFTAIGSIDNDADTITYHYQVYNLNDTVIVKNWSASNNYIPLTSDVGDTLEVRSKATTPDLNSSTYNESRLVNLRSVTLKIKREKDNSNFNISAVDELMLYVVCEDNTIEFNITNHTTMLNISCVYEFLKLDYSWDNETYYRIKNPEFENVSNVTFYMLDLRYDTAVEVIININDLSGEFSNGEISIDRYINNTEVNIIGQPFDIENSVTLYLLKNALYTVSVKNNLGETRVIGGLIADQASEKTLTLPDIDFFDNSAVLGNTVTWNFTYDNNVSNNYVQLLYYDSLNGTQNVTLSVYNYSEQIVFRTSIITGSNMTSKVTITYTPLQDVNGTYVAVMSLVHDSFDEIIYDYRIFSPNSSIIDEILAGSGTLEDDFKDKIKSGLFWIGIFFLFVIGLSFDAQSSRIGLVTVVFVFLMFTAWGFISFGAATGITTVIIAVVAVFNFITKSRRETGGD